MDLNETPHEHLQDTVTDLDVVTDGTDQAPPESPATRPAVRGMVAIVGAAALVVGAGAAGAVIGRATAGGDASRPPTSTSTTAPTAPYGGDGYAQPGGGQVQQLPQDGWGQDSNDSGGAATSSTATEDQIAGLVRIRTTLGYEDGEGAGTGMILTSDGEVLTNHHVVEGATKIEATVMSTGKTYEARVVGTDSTADVAVLQLEDASGLSTVKTDTDEPATGDSVTAVGDANGTTDHLTASPGTVQALDQTITTSSENGEEGETLHDLIQIAAAVVGGDSGGAVYDSDGEVIGMTTAASTTQSVGYAIPIKDALDVAEDLENGVQNSAYAYGRPAFLGVALSTSSNSPTIAKVYDDTPASVAGLVAGDTITRVGDTRVRTSIALRNAIAAHSPGERVRISWTDADGTSHIGTVTLTEGPVS